MIGEWFQRTIDVDGPSIAAVRARLLEGRQHHASARALQRLDKYAVRRRVRWGREIDVEHDVPHTGAVQPPQQVGVEPARPGPDANLLNRGGIDGDNDDVAAGLALLPGEPQIRQL